MIFVDNIAISISKECLWQIYKFKGKTIDIFLSRKKRRSNQNPFAFVHSKYTKGADRARCNLKEIEIRVNLITVKKNLSLEDH